MRFSGRAERVLGFALVIFALYTILWTQQQTENKGSLAAWGSAWGSVKRVESQCETQRRGAVKPPSEGQSREIVMLQNVSSAEFLERCYKAGVPCIVKDATEGWPGVNTMNSSKLKKMFETEDCSLEETWLKEDVPYLAIDREFQNKNSNCPRKMWNKVHSLWNTVVPGYVKRPYFLPEPLSITGYSAHDQPSLFWLGYQGAGAQNRIPHQDYFTCNAYYQVQLYGRKQWRIQSPFTSSEDGSPPSVYDFEMVAGDILFLFPQFWHNTTVVSSESVSYNVELDPRFDFPFTSDFFRKFARSVTCNDFLESQYEQCVNIYK